MTAPARRDRSLSRLVVIGRGKVGSALARASRASRMRVTLRSAREVAGEAAIARAAGFARAQLIVIAAADAHVIAVAAALATLRSALPPVVHCAGALGAEALEPLRARGVPVATMHPLLSFADARRAPELAGAALVIDGDALAVRAAGRFARRVGMTPVVVPSLDRARYHAAAALIANGAAALAAVGARELVRAGVDRGAVPRLVGPLLASVGSNVLALGPERALSGPVRRGDLATVQRHFEVLQGDSAALYGALVQAQLPLASAIGEAPQERLDDLAELVQEQGRR